MDNFTYRKMAAWFGIAAIAVFLSCAQCKALTSCEGGITAGTVQCSATDEAIATDILLVGNTCTWTCKHYWNFTAGPISCPPGYKAQGSAMCPANYVTQMPGQANGIGTFPYCQQVAGQSCTSSGTLTRPGSAQCEKRCDLSTWD